MIEQMSLEVEFKELINRGLNLKAENIHPQVDRLLKEIIKERVQTAFPKTRNQPWHYISIRYSNSSDKYTIVIAPGHAPQKG